MKKNWQYAEDVMDNATSRSFRLALRISLFHLGALQSRISIALILTLYNNYLLVHNDFESFYNLWKIAVGTQKSKTQEVNNALRTLSGTKARQWDTAIQQVYDVNSNEYKALLPNGRSPFQKGTQTDRKSAVSILSGAIGTNPLLVAVKVDVDSFYTLLNTALVDQKSAISTVDSASTNCETARIAMCQEQYSNLGQLMSLYKSTPKSIESFFDLKVLRNGLQVIFLGHVKKSGVHTIVQRTILATDQLILENDGVTELRFYLSDVKNGVIGATFVSVAAGAKTTVTASMLGNVSTQHFLMVFNPDTINKGEFTVEMV